MMSNSDRLIEIIEDHTSMELAFRVIMEAMLTKELPSEGSLPVFNDELVQENVIFILEKATGKEYCK